MNAKLSAAALALVALLSPQTIVAQRAEVEYLDASLPIEDRVEDLLDRMSLEEKFWQLFMVPGNLDQGSAPYANGIYGLQITTREDSETTPVARSHAERINSIQRFFVENTRLGIPIIPFDEALHGLARPGATSFPQAIGLAATWDTSMMRDVSRAIARETRSRGIRQVLSPVVNIADDVRWGRVEETYGEDPYLASQMASVFVSSFEESGVMTTPKHLVANVGLGGRDSYPIDYSRRLLEEYFFPPFRAAISAGAGSIMSAYNSVDGAPATQSRWLLTDILRRQWGFKGVVVSDAAATGGATVLHFTEPDTPTAARHAFEAGLDVVFQSSVDQHRPYREAFEEGLIAGDIVDSAVAHVLRAKFALGLFDAPYVDPDTAAFWNGNLSHHELARRAAQSSIVLLKNDNVLPLRSDFRNVALIGSDAVDARLGGYSGPGVNVIPIRDALLERTDRFDNLRFVRGPGRTSPEHLTVSPMYLGPPASAPEGSDGVVAEYFDNPALSGEPRIVRNESNINARWTLSSPGQDIPFDWYSVRWTGTITAPRSGVTRLGVEGNDGYRLWLNGELIVDNWQKQSYRTITADVTLEPGTSYNFRLEYFETTGNARVKLVWDAGVPDWRLAVDSAVTAANASEVAIIVAGIEEGEFRDRAFLSLPGHQEELIRAVAATGKPVVVVLVGGSAITMSGWLDSVGGVLDVWYPGEAGGDAVADVLLGDYNPAGRFPITFPIAEGQLPLTYNHKPTGRGDDYVDLTGYAAFPFGFGLSYTTFEYSALEIDPSVAGVADGVTVSFNIRNTGDRAGDEVAQLYVRDLLASRSQPVQSLQGFARVSLAAGADTTVAFRLKPGQLSMLNGEMRRVVEPGRFRIMVGASSQDIRLRGEFEVQ